MPTRYVWCANITPSFTCTTPALPQEFSPLRIASQPIPKQAFVFMSTFHHPPLYSHIFTVYLQWQSGIFINLLHVQNEIPSYSHIPLTNLGLDWSGAKQDKQIWKRDPFHSFFGPRQVLQCWMQLKISGSVSLRRKLFHLASWLTESIDHCEPVWKLAARFMHWWTHQHVA